VAERREGDHYADVRGLYPQGDNTMTIGPATILAIIAALLATLLWALCNWKPTFWPALGMFLFGAALVLVMLAGPLIKLP
jgi:hypothetical protein